MPTRYTRATDFDIDIREETIETATIIPPVAKETLT
jgi:hypothetical protein